MSARIYNRSGNLIVTKTQKNQAKIYDLKTFDQIDNGMRILECNQSISSMTINEKDCLVAILVENNQSILLYDITLNRMIEHQNQIECFPFDLLFFIHLKAIWFGKLSTNKHHLEFHIQPINDYTRSFFEISLEFSPIEIVSFFINEDLLLSLFKCSKQSYRLVRYLILDSREIKQKKYFDIDHNGSIYDVRSNWNNTLLIYWTDTNLITLIDQNDQRIAFDLSTESPIRSIDFDRSNHSTFLVATERSHHLCFYSKDHSECYRHDFWSIDNYESNKRLQMIAFQIPLIFELNLDNGEILMKQKENLNSYLKNQAEIVGIFAANSLQYRKFLFDSTIDQPYVWRLMAKRSLLEENLADAFTCTAKMGDAGLVRALKQEMAYRDPKIVAFILMIHLDLAEKSEKMLEEIDASELSRLYSLQGEWKKAFNCSDKIDLKNLFYKYAKQLEMDNEIDESIHYYERSGNVSEVLRMLFENDNLIGLKNYCLRRKSKENYESSSTDSDDDLDRNLISWWGQYCESQGDAETAVEMYESAGDYYNLVRILCHLGQLEQAMRSIEEKTSSMKNDQTSNEHSSLISAILFLGKHLESIDSIKSIEYYLRCSAIRHALQICITHEHYDRLVEIAVRYSTPAEARNLIRTYFPKEEDFRTKTVDKIEVAKLYYKANLTKTSILFAFKHRLWPFLREILSEELDNEQREYLIESAEIDLVINYLEEDINIIDIVVDLILLSDQKSFDLITEIIHRFGIDLGEEIMLKLENYIEKHQNNSLTKTIAEICLEKGNYQLAAKLFNKIDRRVDAIKALILNGQIEKIIQFANVARDKVVWKLAANFLQTIQYSDQDLIVKFYKKAGALDELARYRENLSSNNNNNNNSNHPQPDS
ncbi:Intraflagellar transport protein -like protein [Sarcoptes scabiei]|uniref:Intraflagellar transport protein -like protein n=1 Tax=Sarcoptes scabiei TaxID=52283 RepID=A0A834VBH2_SARSC|nr:Intraflagellar transport protein -like protein [Sarcoptes scabiei]